MVSETGTNNPETLTGSELNDTLIGLGGDDSLEGLGGNDSLDGGANDDTLVGGTGDDTLQGGTGADTLLGGTGSDVYFVDTYDDRVFDQGIDDNDEIRASLSWNLPYSNPAFSPINPSGGIEDLTLLEGATLNSSGYSSAGGNQYANILTGNSDANRFVGREGADTIIGLGGNDTLIGGGDDPNTLIGGTGDDTYNADPTQDILVELAGEGDDTLAFFSFIDGASWTVPEHFENFDIGGGLSATFIGNAADNLIDVSAAASVLRGEAGADTLIGGSGSDTLIGGTGDDVMTGGTGADIFDFSPGGGNNIITDFELGVDVLTTSGFGGTPTRVDTVVNGNTVVTFNGDTTVTLQGVVINRDPTFTSTPSTAASEGTAYSYAPGFSDPDGDTPSVDLAQSTVPDWITYNPANGTFSGTPDQTDTGLTGNLLIIAITDGNGGTATQSFTIDVNANPIFSSVAPGPINEDEEFTFNFLASDPDGDPVSIVPGSLVLPSWMSIANGGLVGTPTQANVGTIGNEVSLSVQDDQGGTATQSFFIEVLNVNDDPTFTTTAITTAQTGTVYTYTPQFADDDGDIPAVVEAQSTIPNWLTFDPNTGTFSGTPQQSDAGLVGNNLIIVITDGMGGTATQTAAINVAFNNQNPVFTSTPPLSTDEDALFGYQILATDPARNRS